MNIVVLYRSMTGHSKKIAKAIAAELGVEAQNIKAKPELNGIDLLFVVGGIYKGKSMPDMIEYIKTLNPDKAKKAVLITSSASDKKGQNDVREVLLSNNIEVVPEECRLRGNFLFIKLGHPNKTEIAEAISFAKKYI